MSPSVRWEEKSRKGCGRGGDYELHGGDFSLPRVFALKFTAGGHSFIAVKTDREQSETCWAIGVPHAGLESK